MDVTAPLSLVQLLSHQITQDSTAGIRLALHPHLVEPLQLCSYPFLHVAATGNVALALHIYGHGFMHSAQLVLGTMWSAGVSGSTPWQKQLAVSPSDVAKLAGHARLAHVLSNMEAQVPLHWSPQFHKAFPAQFKLQARAVMQALCSSAWFAHLPGPARTCITSHIMNELAKSDSSAWGPVTAQEWQQAKKGDFGPEINAQLQLLLHALEAQADRGLQDSAPFLLTGQPVLVQGQPQPFINAAGVHNQVPAEQGQLHEAGEGHMAAVGGPILRQWQFRMIPEALGCLRRGNSWPFALLQGALSVGLFALAMQCKRSPRTVLSAYLAGTCAGMGLTLPSATMLLAQLLGSIAAARQAT